MSKKVLSFPEKFRRISQEIQSDIEMIKQRKKKFLLSRPAPTSLWQGAGSVGAEEITLCRQNQLSCFVPLMFNRVESGL